MLDRFYNHSVQADYRVDNLAEAVEVVKSLEDGIRELCHAFRDGKLPNSFEDDKYINVKTLKKFNLR